MQELTHINQGKVQGKRVIVDIDPENQNKGIERTRWGTIMAIGPDVENTEKGDRVMFHENSITEFPFSVKRESNLTVLENYGVTDCKDLIYVLPKSEVNENI